MILNRLKLKNIKSYKDATINFEPGVNGINGENGHGKTTILEAIGYTLFDYLPYPEKDFLRRSTKSGKIELEFTADDDITYTLMRKVGGSDMRLSTPIGEITGKKDVQDWLVDNLFWHVPDFRDIRSAFENAVGVPQGTFTTAFSQTPAARKAIFDGVLGVDEYKKAYTNLLPAVNKIKERIDQLGEEEIVLRTETKNYTQLKKEQTELQSQITQLTSQISQTKQELTTCKNKKEEQETLQKSLHELEKNLSELKHARSLILQELSRIKKDLEQAESSEKILTRLQDKKREYDESTNTLKQLYDLREQRNKDENTTRELEKRLEVLKDKEQRKNTLLTELTELRKEREKLAPLAEKQDQLTREIATITKELTLPLQQLIFEKKIAQEELKQIETLTGKIQTLTHEQQQLLPQTEKQKQLKTKIEEKSKQVAITSSRISELQKKKNQLGEKNLCPLLTGVKCKSVNDFNTHFTQELNKHQTLLNTQQTELTRLQQTLELLKDPFEQLTQTNTHLLHAQEQLDKLKTTPEKLKNIDIQLEALSTKFHKYTGKLSGTQREYDQIKERLNLLESQLNNLGDANSKLSSKDSLIQSKQQEYDELSEVSQQVLSLEKTLKEHNNSLLKRYAGLDETLELIEHRVEKLQPAHETYLQHKPIAEKKNQHLEEHNAALNNLKTKELELEKLTKKHQELNSKFNETKLRQLTDKVNELSNNLSGYQSTHLEKTHQLESIKTNLTNMETKLDELKKIKDTIEEEKEFQSYLTFIRDLLNNSGQLIVLELINEIASNASNTYCEIMNDYSLELQWSEDYNITLLEDGEERNFLQLSGGEQMSAALALRLALLKVISKSDFVFLDEPTQNMDSQRRTNFSEQIRNIHGFKQFFIISHDDTFNEYCDHVIHVEKINGESRIN